MYGTVRDLHYSSIMVYYYYQFDAPTDPFWSNAAKHAYGVHLVHYTIAITLKHITTLAMGCAVQKSVYF